MEPKLCVERRNRIRLSVAAYAYEFENRSIMSDAEFDELSRKINPTVHTDNLELDHFFQTEFQPDTGMWIHKHPQLDGIRRIYTKTFRRAACG